MCERDSGKFGVVGNISALMHKRHLLLKRCPTTRPDQTNLKSLRSQSLVGIVVPQLQAILSPASEHSIRLFGTFCNQIINQNADVGLMSTNYERSLILAAQSSISAGDEPLGRSFLVP